MSDYEHGQAFGGVIDVLEAIGARYAIWVGWRGCHRLWGNTIYVRPGYSAGRRPMVQIEQIAQAVLQRDSLELRSLVQDFLRSQPELGFWEQKDDNVR